jgi:nicotinate-nucleotide pyrophosphorylase (carboxylating)
MKKNSLVYDVKLFQSQISQLTITNPTYRKFATDLLELLLHQDIDNGDATTALLKNPHQNIQAEIRAKENGILAGIEEAEFFLKRHGVRILKKQKDGIALKKNTPVFTLQASAKKILTCERTVLNLLQRMSGIATESNKLAQKIGKNKFAATRKTQWGLLDTKAVVIGGGLPHRLHLADMILIKENHLAVDPNCWQQIESAQKCNSDFFEIEADSAKFAIKIATHFSDPTLKHGVNTRTQLILMLDNFTPSQLCKLIPKLRQINPKIILEASGGITRHNAKKYLNTRVDYVSLGEITHSAKVLDFSLFLLKSKYVGR